MARLILTLAALALLTAVAVYIGEVIGERRERRRIDVDLQTLSSELHTQNAALMAIPGDDYPAILHGRLVATEHRDRWLPALDRMAARMHLRRAA
ncbi:hypothetical protein MED01_004238 [Micromonospora sp. MED01]|uniref:hypothetical protein n=1 Tax=Micromonospora alfalfae TaxID=2911212 RepID=UPI001EE83703|nr:hypothetical protein [Micromonospora alfalfae]MCG5460812.1 hypothetical protein [Micromonospora alfalfae]